MANPGSFITEEDLHAYVDGRLDAERQQAVVRFLQHHPEIAQRAQAYRVQRQQLQVAFAPRDSELVPPALDLARLIEARLLAAPQHSRWRIAASAVLALGVGSAA